MPLEGPDNRLESWFLASCERGNDLTALDRRRSDGLAWSTGNRVETLVHGAAYFRRLLDEIRGLQKGDALYFTDWRGDPDQHLADDPDSEVEAVLANAARRGVAVKGLLGVLTLTGSGSAPRRTAASGSR